MSYDLIRQCITLLLDSMCFYAMCKALVMRSNRTFFLCAVGSAIVAGIMAETGVPNSVRMVFGILTFGFGLPIGMSVGPLRRRIVRTALINIVAIICEFAAVGVYLLIAGVPYPQVGSDGDIMLALPIYAITFLVEAVLLQLIIVMFERADDNRDAYIDRHIAVLLLWSCGLCAFLELWIITADSQNVVFSFLALGCSMLTLVLGLVVVPLAHTDARIRRQVANHAVSIRQVKHVRTEVESLARRSHVMRQLRHDIANQVDVVLELARAGRVEEADRYLAELQERARAIARQ